MALELIKLVKGSSAVTQVGSLGFFKLSADTGGGGGDLTFSRVFSENTPEQISAVSAVISANNMTSAQVAETYGWNLGDTIDIPLSTGVTMTSRIIGVNHNPELGETGLSLHSTVSVMSATMGTQTTGWGGCSCRNSTMPQVLASMPENWQKVIKTVKKYYKSNSSTELTSEDKLFLPDIKEIGSTSLAGSSKRYEYYKTPVSSWSGWLRTKYLSGGATYNYYYSYSKGLGWRDQAGNYTNNIYPMFCV